MVIAREIVIGNGEAIDATGKVLTPQSLDIVGASVARLAALHVDDRAEAASQLACRIK